MAETSTRPDLWGAIERATGIHEAEWLELFAPHREATHGELAEVAVIRLEDIAGPGGLLEGKTCTGGRMASRSPSSIISAGA